MTTRWRLRCNATRCLVPSVACMGGSEQRDARCGGSKAACACAHCRHADEPMCQSCAGAFRTSSRGAPALRQRPSRVVRYTNQSTRRSHTRLRRTHAREMAAMLAASAGVAAPSLRVAPRRAGAFFRPPSSVTVPLRMPHACGTGCQRSALGASPRRSSCRVRATCSAIAPCIDLSADRTRPQRMRAGASAPLSARRAVVSAPLAVRAVRFSRAAAPQAARCVERCARYTPHFLVAHAPSCCQAWPSQLSGCC